ncbi:hypothetical protein GLYMA_18G127801v4 [Glycine max]|nr:hypothetical protein GLYMA_18G127801v4 [Glycine max]KAH1154305.1 hypothetical protein GYH30_049816 [Glycine max]KAH1197989.1 Disease resistance-like protein DSC1 [Glycine max]
METSSSSNDSKKGHEVLLSFRGDGTRNTFTGHLNVALKRCDIRTYINDHDLKRGDEISYTLLKEIEDANLSVIIFSKNFATSKWYLKVVLGRGCQNTRVQTKARANSAACFLPCGAIHGAKSNRKLSRSVC